MRKKSIQEEGKVIFCDEADFLYMDDLISGAVDVLEGYNTPVAAQYLRMARQLLHCRRLELFEGKSGYPCLNNYDEIVFRDRKTAEG